MILAIAHNFGCKSANLNDLGQLPIRDAPSGSERMDKSDLRTVSSSGERWVAFEVSECCF
jgi:hypothetical protein